MIYIRIHIFFVLFQLLLPLGKSDVCNKGPTELYAIADEHIGSLYINSNDVFQLFGEDVQLVVKAFLSLEPTCSYLSIALKKSERKKWKNMIEFVAETQPLESPGQETTYFFCTIPHSNIYNHLVEIPPGSNNHRVYFMIPVLALALCMSATFSGLNLAIMSFSINDLKLIQESDTDMTNRKRAGDVLRLRRRSNFVLCTIVCGNCFCNTTITILTNYFGEVFGFGEFFFVELVAAGLLLIFTEILPALICTKNALYIASKMQYFVIFTMIITCPISFTLSLILDRILGKEDADDSPVDVDSGQLEGLRGETQNNNFGEMMNVVKKTFELRQKRAENVMTPMRKVHTIREDQWITEEFLQEKYEKGHSSLPVCYGDNENKILGVLNMKDLMLLMDDEGRGIDSDISAGTMLSLLEKRKKHSFVLNTMPIQQFMSELQQGCTMAIVVEFNECEDENEDEYEVIGIITLEDYMEEIVGEIADEKDKKNGNEGEEE